jgi:mannan endo-1,4-beta-mannosidase
VQAYKNWISHLLNRENTYNGLLYKNDPTIFGWELANEPRCAGSNFGASSSCSTSLLSTYSKEVLLEIL